MHWVVLGLLQSVPLPPECEPPPLRDALPLRELAQLDGALSVGLDSVATWCFDPGGNWTGGSAGKTAAKAPQGECARAVGSCEQAQRKLEEATALRALVKDALADLDRGFRGAQYVPRRSGLQEKPSEEADCRGRARIALFNQAQARMDLARLASMVQAEYGGYRAWLYGEGLKCRSALMAAKQQAEAAATRLSVSVDAPPRAPGSTGSAGAGRTGGTPVAGNPSPVSSGAGSAVAGNSATGSAATGGAGSGSAGTGSGGTGSGGTGTSVSGTSVSGTSVSGTSVPGSVGTGSIGTGSVGTGSMGTGTVGTGSSGTGSAGTGNAGTGSSVAGSTGRTGTGGVGNGSTGTGQAGKGGKPVKGSAASSGGPGKGSPVKDAPRAPAVAEAQPTPAAVAAAVGAPSMAPAAIAPTPRVDRTATLAKPMLEKWKAFAVETVSQEADRDYTLGFLASRELGACDCARVQPAAIVRALQNREGGEQGAALLRDEDAANTRCMLCLLDAFPVWKARSVQQCASLDALSEPELAALKGSDDARGLPPRCFDESAAHRAEVARALAQVSAPVAAAPAAAPPEEGKREGNFVTVKGMTYYRPLAGAPAASPPTPGRLSDGGELPLAAGLRDDGYVPPASYAPVPPREDGRLYVRLSMSTACMAEITPGPILARTGDLLLVPYGARSLTVVSPCGGLAEVYWAREAKPRNSEIFARHQPLRFEFQKQ